MVRACETSDRGAVQSDAGSAGSAVDRGAVICKFHDIALIPVRTLPIYHLLTPHTMKALFTSSALSPSRPLPPRRGSLRRPAPLRTSPLFASS